MGNHVSKHADMSTKGNHPVLKKISIVVIIAILLSVGTVATYAYLTRNRQVENNIKLGYNKIELNEVYNPPLTMAKGISFQKEPYVTNTGNVDCYVRVKSVISDSRVTEALTIDYDTENWTYNNTDGYWYYNKVLVPGRATDRLFTTVTIAEDAPDLILDGFDIYVYAESVQTVEGKTAEQVWSKN